MTVSLSLKKKYHVKNFGFPKTTVIYTFNKALTSILLTNNSLMF